MAAMVSGAPLTPHTITRRGCTEHDVVIDIKFCGICHTDIHNVGEEWGKGKAIFPMVPGHEIAGIIIAVGRNVTKFSVGQTAGIGVIIDSCRRCDNCRRGEEQYCMEMPSCTYNDRAKVSISIIRPLNLKSIYDYINVLSIHIWPSIMKMVET